MAGKKGKGTNPSKAGKKKVSDIAARKNKVQKLVNELNIKFDELEDIRNSLLKDEFNAMTPVKSRKMLEEIKVPSIEVIREGKKKSESN